MISYADRIEVLKERYEPKILGLLADIRYAFLGVGYLAEDPWASHGDSYRWSLLVSRRTESPGDAVDTDSDADADDVDITIEIAESQEYDGTEAGVNFALNGVAVGGELVTDLYPYNYTPRVWVDVHDDEDIEQRWQEFESAAGDFSGLIEVVEKFWYRQAQT